jgi:glycosyltransferase involved in cell wall biosynthesis
VVHAFWAAGPGLVAAAFRMLTRVPAVVTLPGGDLSALRDIGYGARLTRRGRMLVRMALSGASVVAAPSEWMRAKAETLGFAAIRLPYGVALDRWPVRAPGPRQPGAPLRLIHIANLNRVKDQPVLLEALRQLADCGVAFHLDVIGLDTLAGEIQRRCAALGLGEHVAFHGLLPHHAVRPWIERADILVMSSQHEGVPIVVLEAAVAGVPTVGTAVGTIADWAPDATVAVPVGNAAALAREIGRIAADETERLRLAQAAQVRAVAEDADAAAGMMRDLYARLKRGETSASAPSLNLPPQPRK